MNGRPIDVLILADVSPMEATRFGYTLNTHARIWRTAVDMIQARIEHLTDKDIPDLLARAESKAEAKIEDPALRETMLGQLTHYAANSLAWLFFGKAIVRREFTVEIRGSGWEESGRPLSGPAERDELISQAKLLLHQDVTGEVSPAVMNAAGAGTVILTHRHPRDEEPGGLATLLTAGEECVTFAGVRDLLATIADLLAEGGRLGQISQKARSRCLSNHMPFHRLDVLRTAASS
jgi:hypothetical protein